MRNSVGLALEADRLLAHLPNGTTWVRALSPIPDGDTWADLADGLRELDTIVGNGSPELNVALMPPLAQVRRLELPGVSEREAEHLARRDPSRFVPVSGKSLVVEVQGSGWRRLSPFLFVAAPSAVIEAIGDAARQSGWKLGGIVPAQFAWAAAGRSRHGRHDVAIALATHVEILRGQHAGVDSIRRLAVSSGALTTSELRAAVARHGVELSEDALVIATPDEAAEAAARHAHRALGPALLPEIDRQSVGRRERHGTLARFAAAAVLVAVAGGLTPWRLSREHANVAAERARIRATVAQARAVRESLAAFDARLDAVQSLERDASHWSALVATLADKLPASAFLFALSASGDTLRLEGGATRAAPVFDSLATVAGVKTVRPEGPIRQEIRADGSALEHFVLAASLATPNGYVPGVRP